MHTPGPWEWFVVETEYAKEVRLTRGGLNGDFVMMFKRKGMGGATPLFYVDGLARTPFDIPPGRQKATHGVGIDHPDARLIAAAPDLLGAAEAHVAACGSGAIDCESCRPFKAAIAKARGEP
jgi:hypothetical protein